MKKYLIQLAEIRQDEIYGEGIKSVSPEYANLELSTDEIYSNLKSNLSNEMHKLFINYCDYKNQMEVISNSLFYQQGLLAGAKLLLEILTA